MDAEKDVSENITLADTFSELVEAIVRSLSVDVYFVEGEERMNVYLVQLGNCMVVCKIIEGERYELSLFRTCEKSEFGIDSCVAEFRCRLLVDNDVEGLVLLGMGVKEESINDRSVLHWIANPVVTRTVKVDPRCIFDEIQTALSRKCEDAG